MKNKNTLKELKDFENTYDIDLIKLYGLKGKEVYTIIELTKSYPIHKKAEIVKGHIEEVSIDGKIFVNIGEEALDKYVILKPLTLNYNDFGKTWSYKKEPLELVVEEMTSTYSIKEREDKLEKLEKELDLTEKIKYLGKDIFYKFSEKDFDDITERHISAIDFDGNIYILASFGGYTSTIDKYGTEWALTKEELEKERKQKVHA